MMTAKVKTMAPQPNFQHIQARKTIAKAQTVKGHQDSRARSAARVFFKSCPIPIEVGCEADDIVCAVHAYKAGATKNVAMRFYYAGAAL